MSEDTFILGTYTKRSIMQCNATNKEEIGGNHAGPYTFNTNIWGIILLQAQIIYIKRQIQAPEFHQKLSCAIKPNYCW